MYERIMVPLDGSAFSEAAIPLAFSLSRRTGASVHLVTVIEPISAFAPGGLESTAEEWAKEYLRGMSNHLRADGGGDLTTAAPSGQVIETLLAEAASYDADIVVMATHGRGAFSRLWLGSVTDALLRQIDRPLLLVRPQDREAAPSLKAGLDTLLVPLDGSELSECALAHATEFGELFGAAYHLTRVVPYPFDIASAYLPHTVQMNQDFMTEAKADSADYLETHAERMRRRGLRVTTSVAVDPQAGRGILNEAEAVGCDSIAMATHGRTGISRVVLGSAADKVVRGTHSPLLLYRPAKTPA